MRFRDLCPLAKGELWHHFSTMARHIWIGTSGFGYKEWKPSFYPKELSDKRFLEYYATRLDAVEIDSTFYRMPTAALLESWLSQTHDGFRFSLKASQRITHSGRLAVPSDALRYFTESAGRLGPRLGALLYQLPPFLKLDEPRLTAFLAALPREQPSAFEFRHPSWFAESTFRLLRDHGAALCIHDSDELQTPLEITGAFTYVRLRRDRYNSGERDAWKRRFSAWAAQGTTVFAFIKHKNNPRAPQVALDFAGGLDRTETTAMPLANP